MASSGRSSISGVVMGLVIGVPVGLGAGFLLVREGRARNEATWTTVPVLVTSRALPAGHHLSADDFAEASWPRALVTEGCSTPSRRTDFVGQTLRWRVAPETVVRDTDLVRPDPSCAARVARAVGSVADAGTQVSRLAAALREHHGAP